MVSYSFGEEGVDRHIVVYKKQFVPCEDELNALRRGEEWNEEKAKIIAEKVNPYLQFLILVLNNIRVDNIFLLIYSTFLEETRAAGKRRI